jgi:rhodanese-related sulfurtransferase
MFNLFAKRAAAPDATAIGHEELERALSDGACAIVDVREPDEYAAGHILGALNLPMSRFDARQLPAGKPVVLVCRSGGRSANALRQALAAGRSDVRHYAAGTLGWRERGGQVVR